MKNVSSIKDACPSPYFAVKAMIAGLRKMAQPDSGVEIYTPYFFRINHDNTCCACAATAAVFNILDVDISKESEELAKIRSSFATQVRSDWNNLRTFVDNCFSNIPDVYTFEVAIESLRTGWLDSLFEFYDVPVPKRLRAFWNNLEENVVIRTINWREATDQWETMLPLLCITSEDWSDILPSRIQAEPDLRRQRQLFFNDLCQHYWNHPERRSYVDDPVPSCMYDNGCGCRCAIGRWLPINNILRDENGMLVIERRGISGIIDIFPAIYATFPKWLTDLGSDFLVDMQKIHDIVLAPNYEYQPDPDSSYRANRAVRRRRQEYMTNLKQKWNLK